MSHSYCKAYLMLSNVR